MTVRVPTSLYVSCEPLVKGVGCPSWGQLIAWSVRDHPKDVQTELAAVMEAHAHRARGRNRSAVPTSPISPRFTVAERKMLDEQRAARSCTWTQLVIAALTVARRHDEP